MAELGCSKCPWPPAAMTTCKSWMQRSNIRLLSRTFSMWRPTRSSRRRTIARAETQLWSFTKVIQVVQLKADLLATQEEDFSEGAQEKKRQRLAEKKAKEETAMDQEVQVLMTMQQGAHEVKEPVGASALRRTHDHPAAQPSSDHRIIGSADHRIIGPADQRISEIIGSADQRIIGSADQRISGSSDQRISGSSDHRISGSADQRDHRISGSSDHRIIGSADHRISGSARSSDQRIIGSADHRISGSSDQRISGSADHRISGSADQRIIGSADHGISGSVEHCLHRLRLDTHTHTHLRWSRLHA